MRAILEVGMALGGDKVDIARLSMMKSQATVKQGVNLSLLKKTMDLAKIEQASLIDMMMNTKAIQHAAEPHKGGNIDLSL